MSMTVVSFHPFEINLDLTGCKFPPTMTDRQRLAREMAGVAYEVGCERELMDELHAQLEAVASTLRRMTDTHPDWVESPTAPRV